jgi:serine/threonine-protein kinase
MFETLGHYKILDRIGAGGMGEVYRARDTRLGRTVAIKVLAATVAGDGERRERFLQEARHRCALAPEHFGVIRNRRRATPARTSCSSTSTGRL